MIMKRLLSILAAAAALTTAAEVQWLGTSHDFGAFVEADGAVSHTFSFINTGNSPVAIVQASASCGCTTPQFSRQPVVPGDTGTVTVSYDPAGRPGRFTKFVGVRLTDGADVQKLFIKGSVVAAPATVEGRYPVELTQRMRLERPSAMLGQVLKGHLKTVTVRGYNASTDTIRPTPEGLPKYLDAQTAPEAVPPGEQFSLLLFFRSNRCPLYGLVTDTVTLTDGFDKAPFDVMAMVQEDFSKLSPKQLAKAPQAELADEKLDLDVVNTPVTVSTALTNTGKDRLEVRRVYTADPYLTVAVDRTSLKHGQKAVITVDVDPSKVIGSLINGRVQVITNDPSKPVQTLRVVGVFPR